MVLIVKEAASSSHIVSSPHHRCACLDAAQRRNSPNVSICAFAMVPFVGRQGPAHLSAGDELLPSPPQGSTVSVTCGASRQASATPMGSGGASRLCVAPRLAGRPDAVFSL